MNYYTQISIECTKQEETIARAEAARMCNEGIKCTWIDMMSCVVGKSMRTNETFCSKLVGNILKKADLLKTSLDVNTMSPSALHRILSESYTTHTSNINRQPTIAIDFALIPSELSWKFQK